MIILINASQSLDASSGQLGNELVLGGRVSGLEVRVPILPEGLARVSQLIQAEAAAARSLDTMAQETGPAQYARPEPQGQATAADPVPEKEPEEQMDLPGQEYFEDPTYQGMYEGGEDGDAIELAAIGEI